MGMLALMGGMALAIYSINYFGQDLPDYAQLRNYDPPVITRIYAGDGRLMGAHANGVALRGIVSAITVVVVGLDLALVGLTATGLA